jgi:hypothetical protein
MAWCSVKAQGQLLPSPLTYSLHGADIIRKTGCQLIKKYPAFFMEPEGSSQCSQKPGNKREEVAGSWRKLHNEELHNLYASPNIIRVVK